MNLLEKRYPCLVVVPPSTFSNLIKICTEIGIYVSIAMMAHLVKCSIGLTETCAGSFVSKPDELAMIGTVGPPLPNVDVCLESVPEMGYDALSSTPCGEICIRGNVLFSGYYKREDLTREVLVDGWFHTGCLHQSSCLCTSFSPIFRLVLL